MEMFQKSYLQPLAQQSLWKPLRLMRSRRKDFFGKNAKHYHHPYTHSMRKEKGMHPCYLWESSGLHSGELDLRSKGTETEVGSNLGEMQKIQTVGDKSRGRRGGCPGMAWVWSFLRVPYGPCRKLSEYIVVWKILPKKSFWELGNRITPRKAGHWHLEQQVANLKGHHLC